jgi:hypothetical protein
LDTISTARPSRHRPWHRLLAEAITQLDRWRILTIDPEVSPCFASGKASGLARAARARTSIRAPNIPGRPPSMADIREVDEFGALAKLSSGRKAVPFVLATTVANVTNQASEDR